MALKNAIILDYNTAAYPFEKIFSALFKTPVLGQLHRTWKQEKGTPDLGYDDNVKLRAVMQALKEDSLFYKVYHSWIAGVVSPHYGGKISYSAHPKMRVHLAGTGPVCSFHRDVDVTGRTDQINCYLPFTDVFDTNTLWVETDYGLKDYHPVSLRYGQAILWDGGYLEHGTVANETGATRVSCDFRFQPKLPERLPPWSLVLSGRDERVLPDKAKLQYVASYGRLV